MLPRRPKTVASGRDAEMSALMEVACHGGVMVLEGASGVGKTSLALECAHRLPRAHWYSAWPRTSQAHLLAALQVDTWSAALSSLEQQGLCLFLDQAERLEQVDNALTLASQQLRRGALIAICDLRLLLPVEARVQRLQLEGVPGSQELPPECQLLTLRPRGLPRSLMGSADWVIRLEERFLTREEEGWLGLHPSLTRPGDVQLHARAAALLQDQPATPIWVEEMFQHLRMANLLDQALHHFQRHHGLLLRAGHFDALRQLSEQLLQQEPRLALAHYARGEAHAGLGKLELAQADYGNAYHWGDEQMRLRSLAGRAHLHLDLGQLAAAERDADEAIALASQLEGRQPGLVKAYNGKSRVCNLRGQGAPAEDWARRALELARSQRDDKGEAYSTFILGQALAEQQRWPESLQNCLSALHFARQQGETRLTLLARYWAGAALLRMGRLEWAAELLDETWREANLFSDLKMRALGELMRAQSLLALGRAQEARQHLQEAERVVQRSGYPVLAVRGLLLKQTLEDDSKWGEQAQRLAESVGLAVNPGALQEVWTQGQCRPLPLSTVAQIRSQRQHYQLFIDLETRQACEGQRGPLSLLGKKIPTSLLLCLMRQPGQCHSPEQLYAAAWGHDYEGETSAAQVRKNISALRTLLEPERKRPRYLLVQEHAYGSAGGYYFSETVSYCVIHPPPLGISKG
jgi:tetratricopeptide (TPR) repeat protein